MSQVLYVVTVVFQVLFEMRRYFPHGAPVPSVSPTLISAAPLIPIP